MLSLLLGQTRDSSAALRDPDWPGWEPLRVYGKAATGEAVSRDKALMLAAVWQSVAMISGDVAKLPLDLYRKAGIDGSDRVPAREHPGYWVCRRKANNQPMTAGQFWRQIVGDALLYNNAYAYIVRDNGRPTEIVPLLPDRTAAEMLDDGTLAYVTEVVSQTGQRQVFVMDASDVLHIRGLMLTNSDGNAPTLIQAARDVIGVALAAQKYQAKFFKNGMRTSGILELPAGMPKPARDKVEDQFRKAHEGEDSWFKTVVLREGAKFQQISQTNQEGETHQLREDQVREVARLFNLPPSKLGLSDSVAYNSKSEDNRAYLDTTLAPWLSIIVDECWLKLLSEAEQRAEDLYFEHNTASLLRMDLESRYRAYQTGISAGFLMRSEARKFENLPAIEGLDDDEETPDPATAPDVKDDTPADDAADSPDDVSIDDPAARWATFERDRWLYERKESRSWQELVRDLREVGTANGWSVVGYEACRKAVARYRAHLVNAN